MKSWKEEVYGIRGLVDDDYNVMDNGAINFNRDDWSDQRTQYFRDTNKYLSAEDIYNYAVMSVKYAQNHSLEDWFNHCNDSQNYEDIEEDYGEDAGRIYKHLSKVYNRARHGIVSMTATYDIDLEELEDEGLITNLRDHGQYYTFKPVVLV